MVMLPTSALALELHVARTSPCLGRSQKYLFGFAQASYDLLLCSHFVQNVSLSGLWFLLVLEKIFWSEALGLWHMPGKLARRKGRV